MDQKEITDRVKEVYQAVKKVYETEGHKLTNRIFFKGLGLKDSTASSILKSKPGKKPVFLPKHLYEAFIDLWSLNRDYFYHGEGEMFNTNIKDSMKPNATFSVENQASLIDEIFPGEEETQFRDLQNGQLLMLVPVVDIFTQAGYLEHIQDMEYVKELPTVDIVVDKRHRGKYLAFKVKGDSMSDGTDESIPNNSIVIGRAIDKELWRSKLHTHDWDDYIIVHKEGTIVKRVIAHDTDKGTITIHSLNPKYEDEQLNLDDIFQMFNVIEVRVGRRK